MAKSRKRKSKSKRKTIKKIEKENLKLYRERKSLKSKTRKKKRPLFSREIFDGIYAGDKIIPYNIHKATMISYEPKRSCESIRKMFGSVVTKTHKPLDPALAARGIRWVRFKEGGEAELHFVPPFHLKHHRTLVGITQDEDISNPLASQFYENHIGLYVPDLTSVTFNVLKHKFKHNMNRRSDGLYQLYVDIPGALDYLEIDSLVFDIKKINKKYPEFKVRGFKENTIMAKKIEKENPEFWHVLAHSPIVYGYKDPKHNDAPRAIYLKDDGHITIVGIDKPRGKKWKINGKIDRYGGSILNFSSKGGPAKIHATIRPTKVTFSDGNVWHREDEKLFNLL